MTIIKLKYVEDSIERKTNFPQFFQNVNKCSTWSRKTCQRWCKKTTVGATRPTACWLKLKVPWKPTNFWVSKRFDQWNHENDFLGRTLPKKGLIRNHGDGISLVRRKTYRNKSQWHDTWQFSASRIFFIVWLKHRIYRGFSWPTKNLPCIKSFGKNPLFLNKQFYVSEGFDRAIE